ncbi:MAG TPA: NAD(+)/NADH kinase, partial [Burkholderiaceae bacterium]|nr:NAD(+)/NADH kinase [Burkholderiaceae bacterium]
SLVRERSLHHRFPAVEFLAMEPNSTVEDTFLAAQLMRAAGVAAIVVLGGDGTHRAVVRECGDVPIAGLSTGTNNAFPQLREPTITGMAVGLFASGRLAAADALTTNKLLEISIESALNGAAPRDGQPERRRDIALVDAVISTDRTIGARALWKTDNLRALYVTFADPEAIGMSAIAGLLHPVGRQDPSGVAVEICEQPSRRRCVVQAPIAPGLVRPVGIAGWQPMAPGQVFHVEFDAGVVALDGERELEFDRGDKVSIKLREGAFHTVDVARCMRLAARDGLFRIS